MFKRLDENFSSIIINEGKAKITVPTISLEGCKQVLEALGYKVYNNISFSICFFSVEEIEVDTFYLSLYNQDNEVLDYQILNYNNIDVYKQCLKCFEIEEIDPPKVQKNFPYKYTAPYQGEFKFGRKQGLFEIFIWKAGDEKYYREIISRKEEMFKYADCLKWIGYEFAGWTE